MKKNVFQFFLVFMFFLLFSTQVYAVPASPDYFEVFQPDGSTFKARQYGDEFQGWTESESGHTILKNEITNVWEYALQGPNGALSLSGQQVVHQMEVPADIPKHLKPSRNIEIQNALSTMIKDSYLQRVPVTSGAEAAPGDWIPVPIAGSKKTLVILINFANRALTTTPATWSAKIFDTNTGAKSVAKYYQDNSFGTLGITPAAHTQSSVPGVVSVTVSDNHPNNSNNFNFTIETTILNHALAQAANYVNFASYDSNGNGTLEQSELMIYFIYSGYEASGSTKTPNTWAHAWFGSGVSAGGKSVTRWALNGELNNNSVQHPIGVIAHELGHALCGLPDLYDTTYHNAGLGNFSLMAGGGWGYDISEDMGTTPTTLDAWSREYLGWATPIPAVFGTLSLSHPLSSQNAVYKFLN